MSEALARVAKRIAGVRGDLSAQDVWLYLAAQYPNQAEKYNMVLYLLEFRGIDPVLLLEAARVHVGDITPIKQGEATLVGSWFPTVAQLKDAVRVAEYKRDMLARRCKQMLDWGETLPMTMAELATRIGVLELELDFFLPEYRRLLALRREEEMEEESWEHDEPNEQVEQDVWEEDEDEEEEEGDIAPYLAVWEAACQALGLFLPNSKQWLGRLALTHVEAGVAGEILFLESSHELVESYVKICKQELLPLLKEYGIEAGLVIEDLVVVVYAEVQA